MTTFIALLRAVNVGGTGKLPMTELRAMCERQGYTGVRTYIASGNVVFDADRDESTVRTELEAALHAYAGKAVGVIVRTGQEMAEVLAANPFKLAAPNHTVALFLDAPPPADWREGVTGRVDEEIAPGLREIYVHYPSNMGRSKLRIRAVAAGTARNMNTVATLAAWASK
jgi:uncharacterized protein (DUF1697 family)